MQAEQTFRPPVQSDCFIVNSCWVWSIYTHLWLRSHSAMDLIFTSVSGKIISWLLLYFYVYSLQFSWVYSWAGLLSEMSVCVLVFDQLWLSCQTEVHS